MRSFIKAATYFTGEAAIPFYRPFGQFLPTSLTTAFCHFVHEKLLVVNDERNHVDYAPHSF
jgi:hypothetical protein